MAVGRTAGTLRDPVTLLASTVSAQAENARNLGTARVKILLITMGSFLGVARDLVFRFFNFTRRMSDDEIEYTIGRQTCLRPKPKVRPISLGVFLHRKSLSC